MLIGSWRDPEFWFTADQQAQSLYNRGEYAAAADKARDPLLTGIAAYRAGDFKRAEESFGLSGKPEAAFNLGNARVFLGKYEAAVESYDRALTARPDWPEAVANREIAQLRAEALKTEGGDMTGGQMGADDIVFNKGPNKPGDQEEEVEGAAPTSETELQAVWLRRLDTKPADFLRSKFAFQAAQPQKP